MWTPLVSRGRAAFTRAARPVKLRLSRAYASGTFATEKPLDVDTTRGLEPTALEKLLVNSIKANGPLQVSRYMQMCLSHPVEGYYMKGDIFGKRGDFITSPEISQVFGELLAIWLLMQWMAASSPSRIRIVELGPGRGSLMQDILRSLFRFEDCRKSIHSVHFVETSELLRTQQKAALQKLHRNPPLDIQWHDHISDIPQEELPCYTMIIAHEFFDALPIHILQKTESGFNEVLIGTTTPSITKGASLSASTPKLQFVQSKGPTPSSQVISASSPRFSTLPIGSRIEVSPASWTMARAMADLINGPGGGAGLIVDYGDDRVFGSSFRGFRSHKLVDVFDRPGYSDLTANVDFAYLKEAMSPVARPVGPITQRSFLLKLGLEPRLAALMSHASTPERRQAIEASAKRLIDPTGMGTQYKVMGILPHTQTQQEPDPEVYPFEART